MISLTTFLTSTLALFGVVVHTGFGPDGKTMVDLTFDLPINPAEPNSAKISVTGTIEQAVAKMEGEYPGWDATFASQPGAAGGGGGGGSLSRIFEPDHYDCNVPGDEDALQEQIFEGIEYLRRLNDTARNGPGPENCGRVSCSWNSAIIWCNNNDFEKELQWRDIANAAAYVTVKCALDETVYVKGHGEYTKEGWYVVLRRDWC